MGGKSKRTFRINGLNAALSKEELDRIVNELNGHEERYKDCLPRISLAFLPDIDGPDLRKCSTVSGRSKRHKKNLLDRVDEYSEWPAAESTPKPLCKDRFGGMTVLHSPENANLELVLELLDKNVSAKRFTASALCMVSMGMPLTLLKSALKAVGHELPKLENSHFICGQWTFWGVRNLERLGSYHSIMNRDFMITTIPAGLSSGHQTYSIIYTEYDLRYAYAGH